MCWAAATATLLEAPACLSDKSIPPAVSLESNIPLARKPHHPRRKGTKRTRKEKPPTGKGGAAKSKSEKRNTPTMPTFTVPLFCHAHKEGTHEEVRNRRCNGCRRGAMFGSPGTRTALFCSEHRAAEHVDVRSKRCEREACDRQPFFGDAAERVPRFCREHAGAWHVDVRSRKCEASGGCVRQPSFGPESDPAPRPDTRCLATR
ncbi:hypothetical protein T484DRAFT_1837473 [Baffinella frigidus]|nr:hypothetical protein T484DRAFT_1837473 [Cryptophyta sp. CCMP2293]